MTRVKRGFVAKKRRKKILKLTKGFQGSHSKLFKTANQQNMRALRYAYNDRRKNKSVFKQLWIKRINIASKNNKLSYNTIIYNIKKEKILINKKILSEIIIQDMKSFKELVTIKKLK